MKQIFFLNNLKSIIAYLFSKNQFINFNLLKKIRFIVKSIFAKVNFTENDDVLPKPYNSISGQVLLLLRKFHKILILVFTNL